MSTTMTNHSRRQILTASSNKRNDRDGVIDGLKPSAITTKNLAKPSMRRPPAPAPAPAPVYETAKLPPPASNNHLLAGYLAQEFLTKGTLFGEPWDLARAEASSRGEKRKSESSRGPEKEFEKQRRYVEVADLLKGEATHLPGIVNPAQLSRFLHGAGHVEL